MKTQYLSEHLLRILCLLSLCLIAQASAQPKSNTVNQATVKEIAVENRIDYKIDSGDILLITVFGVPEMNENPKFRVSSAGLIDYPFLGSIKVTGLTFQEIRNKITSLLDRDYIINPQVLVSPEEFNKQSITIIGAVVKGGLIDIRPDRKYTIIEAIALAGGFTQSANQKKIYLTRDGITQKFNIDQLKDTKDPKKIFYVRPGDTITIGESLL